MSEKPNFNADAEKIAQEILRKVDAESDYRTLRGFAAKLVAAIAITFSVFQLYTAAEGALDAMIQRSIHLSFALCLIFLLYPARKSWSRESIHPIDIVFSILGAAVPLYIPAFYQQLVERAGTVTTLDYIIGLVGILLVLEAVRRVVGPPMVIIASLFIIYALFGRQMPGPLAHRGVDLPGLVQHQFFTTEGIFGIPIGVSSQFIFLFILLGAFLEKTGLGQLFIDLANAIAGWAAGGPAKVAVISSALEGTVSGSSVANTAGSGSFTIPMMKSLGYRPEFAGAVEAVASTGGQIMPPIMGAAAFLMVEFIGVPYLRIIQAAVIPALLYYFGVWTQVHFEAKKLGLRGMKREELPKLGIILKERGHLLIPLIALIYLLATGRTPMKAALFAIMLVILSSMLRKNTRISFSDIVKGLEQGARSALGVVAATACAGIIVGVVTQTGLGLKLGSTLVDLANQNLFLTLFFTMITSLILGMGVPTTANYVITSTIAAPALIMMNVPVLAAHMFAFYFGIIADVTPPVALAAFVGAGIAKANPFRTGIEASKLAIAAFLVPYVFVYHPSMLLINVTAADIIEIVITSIIGIIGVGSAVSGYFLTHQSILERIIFFAGGVLMVTPGIETDLVGLGLLIAGYFIQKQKVKKGLLEIPPKVNSGGVA
ncbi:TRAP transporter permease [Thermosediminibacter oceani]|uniref:TRAP transporter, 4TM/12TM fusion protein n=1 Tax=Thermosediminibacter oceani (strain ATCC BAA-1034 / DSM 16646 / JW/IW-1228P) TaxID=555079 RepID=D9RYC5_THEOJ|nr:TRAP transporter permease [Thermosediminibacter oceani]ADL08349.1 TRAP transporter, 4TM/12TM fusion protein [Thermosediminibacter oceani DSM 16646]